MAIRNTAGAQAAAGPIEIDAPMSGELVSLHHVPDELFASGAMGEGVAILPKNGVVLAPCDGEVLYSDRFLHAIGVVGDSGAEVLIHIGLEASGRSNEPFRVHVRERQNVKKGDRLLTVNLEALKKAGAMLYALVTVTNSGSYSSVVCAHRRNIRAGEKLLTVC